MTKRIYHLALSIVLCLLTLAGCKTGTDVQEAAQYRKNFRAKLESCKQLTLPYKLRMDTHALDEEPSYHAEFDYAWHELLAYILNRQIGMNCQKSHFVLMLTVQVNKVR